MKVASPSDDWLDEPECPDCGVELVDYGRYLNCQECGRTWKRVTVEEQYRPVSE